MWTKIILAAAFVITVLINFDLHRQIRSVRGETERNFNCFRRCHEITWKSLEKKVNKSKDDDEDDDRGNMALIHQLQNLVEDLQQRTNRLEISAISAFLPQGVTYDMVKDDLYKVGAQVHEGKLLACGGKPILFRSPQRWGNPPANYQEINRKYRSEINQLEKAGNVVIEIKRMELIK